MKPIYVLFLILFTLYSCSIYSTKVEKSPVKNTPPCDLLLRDIKTNKLYEVHKGLEKVRQNLNTHILIQYRLLDSLKAKCSHKYLPIEVLEVESID